MASRIDEFRAFVLQHPKIKDEVASGNTTWQKMYEDWVILGENDSKWNNYLSNDSNQQVNNQNETNKPKANTIEELLSGTSIKNVINYVKKIDPDSISKTLNTVQKVLQITQSFSNRPTGIYNNNYNSWWD